MSPETPERAALRELVALSNEMMANRYLLQSRLIPEYERDAFLTSCGLYRDALARAEAVLAQAKGGSDA